MSFPLWTLTASEFAAPLFVSSTVEACTRVTVVGVCAFFRGMALLDSLPLKILLLVWPLKAGVGTIECKPTVGTSWP